MQGTSTNEAAPISESRGRLRPGHGTAFRRKAVPKPAVLGAQEFYRSAMGDAMIPEEGPRMPYRPSGDNVAQGAARKTPSPVARSEVASDTEITSYVRTTPTMTQIRIMRGEYPCFCACLAHCSKLATLHKDYCEFCHGPRPGGPPFILRYYPEDDGWWTLRHQVKRLREIAGLPDFPAGSVQPRSTQPN